MNFEKIIKDQAFYIEPSDTDIVYVRASKLGEYLNSITKDSIPIEPLVSPESGGQLADKMLKANTRLILGDSTSEDEKFLLVNRKFLREYITDLQNMLDDIG